jgi:uncharacterized protein YjiK
MNFAILFALFASLWGATGAPDSPRLLPTAVHHLRVHEPSDICLTAAQDGFFIVGDEGALHRINLMGEIQQTAPTKGLDFEGVFLQGNQLFVVEEMTRRIITYDATTLAPIRTTTVPYFGGRNKAFESLTYNPLRKHYVSITERDPVRIIELDDQFRQVADYPFPKVADISAATFADGSLWLLSDEDATLYALDPATYQVQDQWRLKVLNAEGLAIAGDKLYIVSDDMASLYEFQLPR